MAWRRPRATINVLHEFKRDTISRCWSKSLAFNVGSKEEHVRAKRDNYTKITGLMYETCGCCIPEEYRVVWMSNRGLCSSSNLYSLRLPQTQRVLSLLQLRLASPSVAEQAPRQELPRIATPPHPLLEQSQTFFLRALQGGSRRWGYTRVIDKLRLHSDELSAHCRETSANLRD